MPMYFLTVRFLHERQANVFYHTDLKIVAEKLVEMFTQSSSEPSAVGESGDRPTLLFEMVDEAHLELTRCARFRATVREFEKIVAIGSPEPMFWEMSGFPSDQRTILLVGYYEQAHKWEVELHGIWNEETFGSPPRERGRAGHKKQNLKAGARTAAERAVRRVPKPRSAQHKDSSMDGIERRVLSADDEATLFQKCLRRCCLCYALEGDDAQKEGQLAHLDHNRSNGAPDNFVFLCLRHHNSYDSKMSQAKNITENEVRRHRDTLYQAIERGMVPAKQGATVLKFPSQQAAPVNINGNGNVVAGGDVNYTVNMPRPKRGKGRAATRPPIIPGTVSEDARMIGYLNYLVRRYEKFKKWDCDQSSQRMGWGVIRKAYTRDMKYELIHTPQRSFKAGVRYLQERIENTRLGKMKQGQRLYSPFEDFDEQVGNDEGLPQ